MKRVRRSWEAHLPCRNPFSRSRTSSPGQLAEKHVDRHSRNKIEGVNRSRGEAGETIHHLFMAKLKGNIDKSVYGSCRSRHKECIRMRTGLEKSLGKPLPESERRWEPPEH